MAEKNDRIPPVEPPVLAVVAERREVRLRAGRRLARRHALAVAIARAVDEALKGNRG
jgi:hypothetical protein